MEKKYTFPAILGVLLFLLCISPIGNFGKKDKDEKSELELEQEKNMNQNQGQQQQEQEHNKNNKKNKKKGNQVGSGWIF